MIRIRQSNGDLVNVPKDAAVEIVDDADKLAMVILKGHKGTIRAMTPGDPLFTGYCRTHGMRAAQVHFHETFDGQPMTT